ncbi:MAG TPA: hypothetical protein VL996_01000 [Methylocella sp.]|nr:hypothetical protein [Methylocella sp.]
MRITLTALLSTAFLVGHGPTVPGSLLSDAKIIIADLDAAGALNPTEQTIVHDTRSGLSQLISSNMASISSGDVSAFDESMLLGDLQSAVKRIQADEPANPAVQVDGDVALTALTTLDSEMSVSAQTRAEAAIGAVLIDFLAAKQPSAAAADVRSSISAAIADAHRQISALRGVAG